VETACYINGYVNG